MGKTKCDSAYVRDFVGRMNLDGCGAGAIALALAPRLKAWYDADPQRGRRGGAPFRWAFISWAKDASVDR